MIQRVQTLFLLEITFLAISLLFIPIQTTIYNGIETNINLMPISNEYFQSSLGHLGAIAINIFIIILAPVTIFLFKQRNLQVKLSYLLVILFVILISMIALCPFTTIKNDLVVKSSYLGYIILITGAISAFFAARYVKKDIALLKSTDRIR